MVNDEIEFTFPLIDAVDLPDKTPYIRDDDEEESGLLGMDFIGKWADLYYLREYEVMVLTNDSLEKTMRILKGLLGDKPSTSNIFQK